MFEVWPDNWLALELFLRLQTQWVYTGMGTVVGLNYPAIEFLFRLYRQGERQKLFEEIQELERGALEAFGRINERGAGKGGS